jgi:hypothetical protein
MAAPNNVSSCCNNCVAQHATTVSFIWSAMVLPLTK